MLNRKLAFESEAQWLEWRSKGIGASDVPSVMGEGFSTPYELWIEKTKGTKKKTTQAMALGKKHEAAAVAALESALEIEPNTLQQQVALESVKFPFLRCTLDAMNPDAPIIYEVKCMSGALKRPAKVLPRKYYAQVQMQMYISGATLAFYAEYDIDNQALWYVVVKRDMKYQREMLKKCAAFWACVQNNVPPELTVKERAQLSERAIDCKSDPAFAEAEQEYLEALATHRRIEKRLSLCKDKLIESAGGKTAIGNKLAVQVSYADGALDLDYIPQLKGVDLSRFRKSPTRRITIKELAND